MENNCVFYTGENLKEVIDFTGLHPKWHRWFGTWEAYVDFVKKEDRVFRIFNGDEKIDVPPGTWIFKDSNGFWTAP